MNISQYGDPARDYYSGEGIDCIDAIYAMLGRDAFIDFCRATILRYVWRLGRKGSPTEDLDKIRTYALFIKKALEGERCTPST